MDTPEKSGQAWAACIPNIGKTGRARRLRSGLIWLVAGMAASLAAIRWHLPWPAFAGLYVVFFMAALGYFQASQRT